MKISILIDNYNYPQYVAQAIDSALAQSHPDVEVIVVDDGSTDNCPEILGRYAGRVKLVLKPNGGQASAFNAGFALVTGDLVMLLDADDLLYPNAAAAVAAAWRPGISKLHYALDLIDENGDPLGSIIPRLPLPSGDLAPAVLERGYYVTPPASGNAFSRDLIRQLTPIPDEAAWSQGAESYLLYLSPFFGRTGAITERIAAYRIHGKSLTAMNGTGAVDARRMLKLLEAAIRLRNTLERFCAARNLALAPQAVYSHWLHRKLRLACFKLSRQTYPFPGDTAAGLALSLIAAVWASSEVDAAASLLFSAWAVLTALLPLRLATPLIRLAFTPFGRPAIINALLNWRPFHRRASV